MVLYCCEYFLNDLVKDGNCKTTAEEFQMVAVTATRFSEALQDLCIVEVGVS